MQYGQTETVWRMIEISILTLKGHACLSPRHHLPGATGQAEPSESQSLSRVSVISVKSSEAPRVRAVSLDDDFPGE